MSSDIVPQKRNLQAYSTEAFPDGLYIDNNTGDVFASTRSLARLIGVSHTTVIRFVESEGGAQNAVETAEVQTAGGVQGVALHPESTILKSIKKYKPSLLEDFEMCGLRVFLHGMAGFATISTAVEHPPLTPLEQALQDKIKLLEELKEVERAAAKAKEETTKAKEALQAKEIYFLRAAKGRPGLEDMLNEFQETSEQLCLPVSEGAQTDWTLHEWMVDNCHVVLEDTMFRKFFSKVHGAYKAINHKPPAYGYRAQVNNPKCTKRVQVYTPADFPILHQCYIQTLMEYRK